MDEIIDAGKIVSVKRPERGQIDIAGKKQIEFRDEKGKVTRCMTGGMDHFEGQAAQIDALTVGQGFVDLDIEQSRCEIKMTGFYTFRQGVLFYEGNLNTSLL